MGYQAMTIKQKIIKGIVCSVVAIIGIVTGDEYIQSHSPVGDVVVNGVHITTLQVSARALDIIGNAEGCRKSPYTCPAGLKTDGIGNTLGAIGGIKSDNQIAIDWALNIKAAENCLNNSKSSNDFTQGQFDAFTSFIFNTGCTRFRFNTNGTKTRIYQLIEQGNYQSACGQLNRWVYGGGKKLAGLVVRRKDETQLCLSEPLL